MTIIKLIPLAAIAVTATLVAQDPLARIDQETGKLTPALTEIRHQIHQNPELSNREEKTAALVADYLRKLGLEVQTGVARTGVVAMLKGGKPGPVDCRPRRHGCAAGDGADHLPFASKVRRRSSARTSASCTPAATIPHRRAARRGQRPRRDEGELPGRSSSSFNRRKKVRRPARQAAPP